MSQCKRLFIVGHPGAGKGLLAKSVAQQLGWQFIDADLGLEFTIGRRLTELFGNEGREDFYQVQSELLSFLLTKENIVVATDGSIASSEKNRQLLSQEDVVFLDVSTSVQMERTALNPYSLLPIADLKVFFDALHQERDHWYEQVANVVINSDNNALEEHVCTVVDFFLGNKASNPVDTEFTLEKKDLAFFHRKLHTPVYLSEQQALCLKLLAQGKASKIIAREMGISYRTVEGTLAKTMELLGCTSSKELIALYYDRT
ncbi:shikimate kinase [Legionella fallonii]|uniref:Shikimate kinase n=1 Tax=Legionella fallonii LLAP-10 TaxID=1212491 RepID=A0A098G3Y8_9GAMM|nr:shikimate kinase [Legionella fallonii]CEG57193.1 Shikimate kinase [Legionella fallonii LLAP-10]